jgi:hypothetical protein
MIYIDKETSLKINACLAVAKYILLVSHELCTVGHTGAEKSAGGFRKKFFDVII